jgi:protein-tyrosine phosphatase
MGAVPVDPPPRIDWVPAEDLADGRPGRMGMTVLPGKRGPSVRYPGRIYRADPDADLAALRAAGIGRLILLVEDDELARWGDSALVARAARHGIEVDRHPIPDGSPPASAAAMDTILVSIADGRAVGDVGIACMGGVGRTGTVAACALVAAGWDAGGAIARIRELRHPTAVETAAQERFVQTYWSQCRSRSRKVWP